MKRTALVGVLTLTVIFAVGHGLGYSLWNSLFLPFANPWQIQGPLTQPEIRYNPANDTVRFLVFVALPLLLLLAAYAAGLRPLRAHLAAPGEEQPLAIPPPGGTAGAWLTGLAAVVLATTMALGFSTHSAHGEFDMFHEGEALGPATCLQHGQEPYRDTVFLHGLYQDPYRALLAFRLFGRSIGSVRTLDAAVSVLAHVAMALFVLLLFGRNRGAALFAICVIAAWHGLDNVDRLLALEPALLVIFATLALARKWGPALLALALTLAPAIVGNINWLFAIEPRDVMLYGFLIVAVILHRHLKDVVGTRRGFVAAAAVFALLPVVAFGYSLDRGLYLSIAFVAAAPLAFFAAHGRRRRLAAGFAVGAAGGLLLLGVLLRGNWREFVEFAFVVMPQYKALLDELIFVIDDPLSLLAVTLLALNAYCLLIRLLRHRANAISWREAVAGFAREDFAPAVLLFVSLACFRTALGRSGTYGTIRSLAPGFILSFYLLTDLLIRHLRAGRVRLPLGAGVAFATALLGGHFLTAIVREDLLARSFPLGQPDDSFVSTATKAAADYLRQNLAPDEWFFTLTNEGAWYYLLDRPCPTRFTTAWFAAPPQYQREVIRDLAQRRVKFVILRNANWPYRLDGITNAQRLPQVVDYLRQHFVLDRVIEGNVILKRASLANSGSPAP